MILNITQVFRKNTQIDYLSEYKNGLRHISAETLYTRIYARAHNARTRIAHTFVTHKERID